MPVLDDPDLRPAGPGDAPTVAAVHAASWRRHYRGAYADAYLDGDVLVEREAVWRQRLAAPAGATTILAEEGHELVGFAHLVFDADSRWGALLDNLHVVAGRQRQGIGKRLVAACGRAVVDRDAAGGLYLWVLEINGSAQRFYRALGGRCVERALVEPPGGDPARLQGSPAKLRYAWSDPGTIPGARP